MSDTFIVTTACTYIRVVKIDFRIFVFFGPLFGLIVCDYYFIKKGNIINKDIFSSKIVRSYLYSNGWHYKAIYAVIIGFIFASSTIWNVNMQFLQTFSWLIGAFVVFVTYYLLASSNE